MFIKIGQFIRACLSFSWYGIVFSRVSGMMLCFCSRRKTMLIAHWCLYLLLSRVVQSQDCSQQRAQGAGREQNQCIWLKLAKGMLRPMWHCAKGVLKGVGVLSSAAWWASWAWVGGWWAIACASFFIYVFICTFISTYVTIIFFLSSVLVLSQTVSSTLVNYFFFWFSPPSHWEGRGAIKRLCGSEPPARLKHNRA